MNRVNNVHRGQFITFIMQVYGRADEKYGPQTGPMAGQFAEPQYGATPAGGSAYPGGAQPGSQVSQAYGMILLLVTCLS